LEEVELLGVQFDTTTRKLVGQLSRRLVFDKEDSSWFNR
jgi:hypothetical protein